MDTGLKLREPEPVKAPVVIIGIGELGGVFDKAFLRSGHPEVPVTRKMAISDPLDQAPCPALVLVAVGEKELPEILSAIPAEWKPCVGLLQNELLPNDWQAHGLEPSTVLSVWFEKKPGQDINILLPTVVYGVAAQLVADALATLPIPCTVLTEEGELVFHLVVKNVFVYTINIAGLLVGGATGDLWTRHRDLAETVAKEVLEVQNRLTGMTLPADRVLKAFEKAVNGDPGHKCLGRSAAARRERLIDLARTVGVAVPRIASLME